VEAYEVLSNPERRDIYDRFGHEGLRSGGWAPTFDFGHITDLFSAFFGEDLLGAGRRRAARGGDILAEVEIELVEAAHGVKRTVPFRVEVPCAVCHGSGAEPGTQPITCPSCNGAGRPQQGSRTVFGEVIRAQTCPRCARAGRS